MRPDPKQEVAEARRACRDMLARGVSDDDVVRRLGAMFFVAVYACKRSVFASYLDPKFGEIHVKLSFV